MSDAGQTKQMTNDLTLPLAGRRILVTGAHGGLGRAVVEHLLDQGASVYSPGDVGEGVDLTDEKQVSEIFARQQDLWASVHLVGGFAMAPLLDTSLEAFRGQQRLNLETCFLCCREAVRAIKKTGKGGRILNVAARPAVEPVAGMVAYATSKAGVAALTRLVAAETVKDGILVNAILPSIIDTPANRKSMPQADFDSWPKPLELARRIGELVSPMNTLTSGALIPVYGRA